MTAASMSRSTGNRSGLRKIDTRRDMHAVADLIEGAFSGSLDPAGRQMLHMMRKLSRGGWLGWLINYWMLPLAAHPLGFVWEADGHVVGNASLMKVTGCPGRWVLSNVAVRPDYRRQGIARALVQASIELVRKRREKTILLQVDGDNRGAQVLYASFGFRRLTTRTVWVRSVDQSLPTNVKTGPARRRRRGEWQAQWELARQVHPEGLIWPYPTAASFFRPHEFVETLSFERSRHWVWSEAGQMLASLTARRGGERRTWRLILIVDPNAHGRVEVGLLARGLVELPKKGPVVLDYPVGDAEDELKELGFHPKRTLTWMALELRGKTSPRRY